MTSRERNERKFKNWLTLPTGGRRYWRDRPGQGHYFARYLKEVDANEQTTAFWQEIYDAERKLVAVHLKYPEDKGHHSV